jgi:hypothetical protein
LPPVVTKELCVSRSPIRRHRLVAAVLVALVAIGLLGGCTGQRDPGSYTDAVEENFLKGCVGTSADDAESGEVSESASVWGRADCQCAYDAIKRDVPFSEFKQLNSDLIEEPGPLPESFTKAFADCDSK